MTSLIRYPVPRPVQAKFDVPRIFLRLPDPPAPSGRIMSSLVSAGGLVSGGGIAGKGGGLAG